MLIMGLSAYEFLVYRIDEFSSIIKASCSTPITDLESLSKVNRVQ
jgi:hypothetical protein